MKFFSSVSVLPAVAGLALFGCSGAAPGSKPGAAAGSPVGLAAELSANAAGEYVTDSDTLVIRPDATFSYKTPVGVTHETVPPQDDGAHARAFGDAACSLELQGRIEDVPAASGTWENLRFRIEAASSRPQAT